MMRIAPPAVNHRSVAASLDFRTYAQPYTDEGETWRRAGWPCMLNFTFIDTMCRGDGQRTHKIDLWVI